MVQVTRESMFWVKVGDKCYYDESNGIMCSKNDIHRVEIPAELLDMFREQYDPLLTSEEVSLWYSETLKGGHTREQNS